jgi:hypothetical protein
VYLNLLSQTAGVTTTFGNLQIGANQTVAASAIAAGFPVQTVAFNSVTLTGGQATFLPGFPTNTNYNQADHIVLGPISESAPGSGILVNGRAGSTLRSTGASTYTGGTTLVAGPSWRRMRRRWARRPRRWCSLAARWTWRPIRASRPTTRR